MRSYIAKHTVLVSLDNHQRTENHTDLGFTGMSLTAETDQSKWPTTFHPMKAPERLVIFPSSSARAIYPGPRDLDWSTTNSGPGPPIP